MIVFISCVKSKVNQQTTAENLYKSDLFHKQLKYAKQITTKDDHIYILSAKYGVLELNDIVSPYELTLNNMNKLKRKQWAYKCVKQLQEKEIDFKDKTIFLTGKPYSQYLSQLFPNKEFPLNDLSFGMRLKQLKEWLDE
ncbi:DUF6884 domain-containing protein [Staphylococcus intermedius]|uniref:DUF6884 domain-containing protein n=1 Tax=Staphylococcus intermedius NCTC 11048 TaxID=1141106 RepID=A0A380G7C9_STAIN|nr:DUF6884 domain-containing protein [Staphylococcus intermedius]PCF87403.1 hypothetical protein B4W76_03165 [Staphylococcus intermedius]PNZ52236.1 peroxide stress protein YaaA [Staphylococcus intermedius NCTC 11048]SUM47064.1 Uncharacterised protein [Staphylococcus intermedius NCTC 11048]